MTDLVRQTQDLELLDAAVRTNTVVLAVVLGLAGGAAMWLGTYLLLWQEGSHVGLHLSLLSVFLPGYEVSPAGAWVGFVWGFVLGGLTGWLLYWSYARNLRKDLLSHVIRRPDSTRFTRTTLLISGPGLGIALGALLGLQLFATTMWLVLRGTAEESVHAMLLRNYLPGYDVSPGGGLIGALEVFALTFLGCVILSGIYNLVARRRAAS